MIEPKPLIVCDIDGTLANTIVMYSLAMKLVYNVDVLPENWTSYDLNGSAELHEIMHSKDILRRLPPFTETIDVINQAYNLGYPVIICTDREPELKKLTYRWLKTYGVQFHDLRVGKGNKEYLSQIHSSQNPMFLIDDNPRKWITCNNPGTTILCPVRPYNPPNIYDSKVIMCESKEDFTHALGFDRVVEDVEDFVY